MIEPLLATTGLRKHFPVRLGFRNTRMLRAVDGVDLNVVGGETFGIVGESGSGKSTLARLLTGLIQPTAGTVRYAGHASLFDLAPSRLREVRKELQIVFQDPYSSLNPRMSVGDIVERPLQVHGMGEAAWRRTRVGELFRQVGLPSSARARFPHEFSGGQRQRIAIARALATNPRLVVLDEPTSALDVSVQATILNLLSDLQHELSLTYVLISHDMRVIKHACDRVAVMYLGVIVETAPKADLFREPGHPYTQALLAAVPTLDPDAARDEGIGEGEPPSPLWPPPGCRFNPRCPWAADPCRLQEPQLRDIAAAHAVACHFAEQIRSAGARPSALDARVDDAGQLGPVELTRRN
jgi:oligopeptide/dipeptide ABC transporter ATP-binding protein